MSTLRRLAAAFAALLLAAPLARAADPAACDTVRMSDPGWTDITSTNAVTGVLLAALGYRQKIDTLSVPITFQALGDGKLDVFQGNWMPAQAHFVDPLVHAGKLTVVHPNLQHAKFTLAVPDYVAAAGVTSFADLAKHAGKFHRRIYGIEPGAPANQNIEKMIDARQFGLGRWKLIESSEQGMLAQVARAVAQKQWIVFLAWEPHPMNTRFKLTYLSGGDAYFGPDYGSTTVNTLARKGFASECPNLATLLRQVTFSVGMENTMMAELGHGHPQPQAVASTYLKAHPALLAPWLAGVTTTGGKDGLAAVQAKLGVSG